MDSQPAMSATQGSVCSASPNGFCSTSVEISTPKRQNDHLPEKRSNSRVIGAAGRRAGARLLTRKQPPLKQQCALPPAPLLRSNPHSQQQFPRFCSGIPTNHNPEQLPPPPPPPPPPRPKRLVSTRSTFFSAPEPVFSGPILTFFRPGKPLSLRKQAFFV